MTKIKVEGEVSGKMLKVILERLVAEALDDGTYSVDLVLVHHPEDSW
jgi:hypothetical protein